MDRVTVPKFGKERAMNGVIGPKFNKEETFSITFGLRSANRNRTFNFNSALQ